jgi:hypothetical protein
MWRRGLCLGLLWGGLAGAVQAQAQVLCPTPLKIAFLDKAIPSMLNGDGAHFPPAPGRFVEWTDRALAHVGCSGTYVRLPQRRLVLDTAADAAQVILYLAYTPERALEIVYPLRPDGSPDQRLALAETYLALFVRADQRHRIAWDGKGLQPATLRVGAVAGGVEEPLARAAGWKLDLALSHSASVTKLRAGRVDVALLPASSFSAQTLAQPPALVELEPPLHGIAFFAPVSKALYAKHPEFVHRFWQALCEAARASAVPSAAGAKLPPPSCQL